MAQLMSKHLSLTAHQQTMHPIDLVVTYVDGSDPFWLDDISKYNCEMSQQRFRDWGTLRFLFRGVEDSMPFVNRVYLVVSRESQVPKWLDTDQVDVVLHKDIIPSNLIPTFNSTTIEMFLHKISGLSEHFIYANDDMLPLGGLCPEDFFSNGVPIYELVWKDSARNTFRMQCKNAYRLAAKLSGTHIDSSKFFCIRHGMSPMLKSIYKEVHSRAEDEILSKCTKFREPWNLTQYLFPVYSLMVSRAKLGAMPLQYFSTQDVDDIIECIKRKQGVLCMNDSSADNDFNEASQKILAAFSGAFPHKSRFEI